VSNKTRVKIKKVQFSGTNRLGLPDVNFWFSGDSAEAKIIIGSLASKKRPEDQHFTAKVQSDVLHIVATFLLTLKPNVGIVLSRKSEFLSPDRIGSTEVRENST